MKQLELPGLMAQAIALRWNPMIGQWAPVANAEEFAFAAVGAAFAFRK